MITPASGLLDVAFEVSTALYGAGIGAVLTGGSAAAFYCAAYQSADVDFVVNFGDWHAPMEPVLQSLGFVHDGSHFAHPRSAYTVDFPPGPLGIGGEIITAWETVHRDGQVLFVLSRTDSVRDRLAAFFHWDDRSSLRIALLVARSGPIDLEAIRAWSAREGAAAKFAEFERRLVSENT